MPSWKEVLGRNNYLNLERLGKQVITGEIERIEVNDKGFKGDGKAKLVIDLVGREERITLNLESTIALGKMFGEDYEEWVGGKVKVQQGMVAFGKDGKVKAIVVTPVSKPKKGK